MRGCLWPTQTSSVSICGLIVFALFLNFCSLSVASARIKEPNLANKLAPEPYFTEKARLALEDQGIRLGDSPTALEKLLWKRLLLVSAAAERVLSDVDDDGVAEAHDMAILSLGKSLLGQVLP